MKKILENIRDQQKERILLAMIDFKQDRNRWPIAEIQTEMVELVLACGAEVAGTITCPLVKPTAGYLISEGKLNELADFCKTTEVDTVIFSYDLKGSQQRNLEESIKVRIIDRTQLILDIFAKHATTNDGKLQVELAQLQYLLPRLVGHGIELSQLGGGIGTRGPGETKLEMDRRRIDERVTRLKKDLKDIVANRALTRKKRKDNGLPSISLVGYTNAGKTTLLNLLTEDHQLAKEGLFTTLDSLSRQLILPNHQKVVLSDTVGFMHELPHHLIDAFKATLEEVQQADLLLHVLDVSHPHFQHLYESVEKVLEELKAHEKPVIMVLNKIDKLDDQTSLEQLQKHFDNAVCLCAKTGQNVSGLLEKIQKMLSDVFVEINVNVPIQRMDLVSLVHEEGQVYSIKYYNDSINIRAAVPQHLAGKFISEK